MKNDKLEPDFPHQGLPSGKCQKVMESAQDVTKLQAVIGRKKKKRKLFHSC